MAIPNIDLSNPDDVFGVAIFGFFCMAVLAVGFVVYKIMTIKGEKVKKGERYMMLFCLLGAALVLGYAMLAFVFKIII